MKFVVFTVLFFSLIALGCSPEGELNEGDISLSLNEDGEFSLSYKGEVVLESPKGSGPEGEGDRSGVAYAPMAISKTVYRSVQENFGSYRFEDEIKDFYLPEISEISVEEGVMTFVFEGGGGGSAVIDNGRVSIAWASHLKDDRLSMSFRCREDDAFFGMGSQVSVNHRGHRVPVWTSEQGNGKSNRGEESELFGVMGDHYASYAPVPFATSSRKLGFWLNTETRSEFEFCQEGEFLRFENQGTSFELVLMVGDTIGQTVEAFTQRVGLPHPVARWAFGPWVDTIGGPAGVEEAMALIREHDIPVSALWAEDWVGTLFALGGEHLTYNWVVDRDRFPDLKGLTNKLHQQGIRFLAYVNPMIPEGTQVYQEGVPNNYLVKNEYGEVVTLGFPFGEPPAYFDMTGKGAKEWFWEYMDDAVALGVDGWMADYGESLPYEAIMENGGTGESTHNSYPLMWVGLSREFWDARRDDRDFMFFNRSGYTGIAAKSSLHWLGDQLTSFDRNDGFGSVIPLYITAGLSGIPLTHSDVGGYTSGGGVNRDYELWARWVTLEAFTPFMRTHHSAAPETNIQWQSDENTLELFKTYGRWHQRLMPYFAGLVTEAVSTGAPPVRPIWWHDDGNFGLFSVEDEVLVGADLLVAPIVTRGETKRDLALPSGKWRRWMRFDDAPVATGELVSTTAEASLEEPIVYLRAGSAIPILTQDFDTLAPLREGEAFEEELDAAPRRFEAIGFLITTGASNERSGKIDDYGFGDFRWSWSWMESGEEDGALTNLEVTVGGQTLGPCSSTVTLDCVGDGVAKIESSTIGTGGILIGAGGSQGRLTFAGDIPGAVLLRIH